MLDAGAEFETTTTCSWANCSESAFRCPSEPANTFSTAYARVSRPNLSVRSRTGTPRTRSRSVPPSAASISSSRCPSRSSASAASSAARSPMSELSSAPPASRPIGRPRPSTSARTSAPSSTSSPPRRKTRSATFGTRKALPKLRMAPSKVWTKRLESPFSPPPLSLPVVAVHAVPDGAGFAAAVKSRLPPSKRTRPPLRVITRSRPLSPETWLEIGAHTRDSTPRGRSSSSSPRSSPPSRDERASAAALALMTRRSRTTYTHALLLSTRLFNTFESMFYSFVVPRYSQFELSSPRDFAKNEK
mmetsp:Transcript_14732/g.63235  ORF Transcript_14732/g.63235 Transcript_14732/m.63235 type:complete len:303 (-) Transcript_14732:440-1348(-)